MPELNLNSSFSWTEVNWKELLALTLKDYMQLLIKQQTSITMRFNTLVTQATPGRDSTITTIDLLDQGTTTRTHSDSTTRAIAINIEVLVLINHEKSYLKHSYLCQWRLFIAYLYLNKKLKFYFNSLYIYIDINEINLKLLV